MIWRIYKYTNVITGKSYIGQTMQNVNDRAKNGTGYRKGSPFREAIDKYGWETFEQSILRLCTSQEEADQYEQLFIDKYNSVFPNGYNLQSGGNGGCRIGIHHTDETKRKMANSKSGDKNYWYGTHGPMCGRTGSQHPMYGKHHSDEIRKRISETHKGRHHYNNGIISVMDYECPNGFVPGRLRKAQESKVL